MEILNKRRETSMLLLNWKTALTTVLCASRLGVAQVAPPTVLEVQTENVVAYVGDVSDVLKFATEPGITTVSAVGPRNLGTSLTIADIVAVNGNNAVVGGTGTFVGVRGQLGGGQGTSIRLASITEDPTNRRTNGGGRLTVVVTLIPMSRPEIVTTASGPAVFHADFSPVTAAKPAKAGEVLMVRATGLGPTRPGVDPWQAISNWRAPGRQFTGRSDG
jgi:hypothetical protein